MSAIPEEKVASKIRSLPRSGWALLAGTWLVLTIQISVLIMTAPSKCDVPNGGDDCVEKTPQAADDFVESPQVVKVEAETRPDFKELQAIEKERREILLRVSMILCFYTHVLKGGCLIIHSQQHIIIFIIYFILHQLRRNFPSGVSSSFGVVLV